MRVSMRDLLTSLLVLYALVMPLAANANESLRLQVQLGSHRATVETFRQVQALKAGDRLLAGADQKPLSPFELSMVRQSELGNTVLSGTTSEGYRLLLIVSKGEVIEGFIQNAEGRHRLAGSLRQGKLISPATTQKRLPAESSRSLPQRPKRDPGPPDPARPSIEQYSRPALSSPALKLQDVRFPSYLLGSATIDVLIYHDDDMTKDPAVIADLMVEISNQALVDSDINIELKLVGLTGMTISNQTTQSDLLTSMFSREPPFTAIEEDRAALEADLVIAIRDQIPQDDSSCGIAYIGVDQGFPWRRLYVSSVHWNPLEQGTSGSFCDDTTFAHEVGHILGSMHERRLYEEGDTGAYAFSFGHYRKGWLKTIMSYGSEDEKYFFSNPEVSCGDFYGTQILCGVPAGESRSADNAAGFTNTRHMVAGYYSDRLTHELIVHHRHEGGCELPAGRRGVLRGHSMMNETQYGVEIREFAVMTAQGEVLSETYAAGESMLRAGEEREFGFDQCIAEDEMHPYGNTYLESWITYVDPVSGNLYESIHIPWEEGYQGDYARVTIATSSGGRVDGHTGKFLKVGDTQQFRFVPDSGYRLANIEGSCKGEVEGGAYTVSSVLHDCTIEAYFEVGDGGVDSDLDPPAVAPEGPEGMFVSLLDSVLAQTRVATGMAASGRSVAPPRPSESVADSQERARPIPAVTYLSLLFTAVMMGFAAWWRLRKFRAQIQPC